MKIIARQLVLDLYNCDLERLKNIAEIKIELEKIFDNNFFFNEKITEEKHSILGTFPEGHLILQIYENLRYVAMDIFSCGDTECLEDFAKIFRRLFKPDKLKFTLLKRGDFHFVRDIRPKTKIRMAPLRRVKNVGVKVVRRLVRRKQQ